MPEVKIGVSVAQLPCSPVTATLTARLEHQGNAIKSLFPARRLPPQLNPICVDCDDLEELPLVWWGAVYDEDKVFGWAMRRGWAVKEHAEDDEYDMLFTWRNMVHKIYEKYGMLIRTRDVFGIPGEKLLLTFYANRDIGRFNVKHRNAAHKMFKAMGYAEDEQKWYLDYMEDVRSAWPVWHTI